MIERAVLLAGDAPLTLEHLPVEKLGARGLSQPTPEPPAPSVPPPALQDGGERERIIAVLDECVGNQTRAAQRLGMTRRQLISRLERYGPPRPRK